MSDITNIIAPVVKVIAAEKRYVIDPAKVKTIEDVVTILQAIDFGFDREFIYAKGISHLVKPAITEKPVELSGEFVYVRTVDVSGCNHDEIEKVYQVPKEFYEKHLMYLDRDDLWQLTDEISEQFHAFPQVEGDYSLTHAFVVC